MLNLLLRHPVLQRLGVFHRESELLSLLDIVRVKDLAVVAGVFLREKEAVHVFHRHHFAREPAAGRGLHAEVRVTHHRRGTRVHIVDHLRVADVFHAAARPDDHLLAVTVAAPALQLKVRDIRQVVIHHPLIVRVVTGGHHDTLLRVEADEFPGAVLADHARHAARLILDQLHGRGLVVHLHRQILLRPVGELLHGDTRVIGLRAEHAGREIELIPAFLREERLMRRGSHIDHLAARFLRAVDHPGDGDPGVLRPGFEDAPLRAVIRPRDEERHAGFNLLRITFIEENAGPEVAAGGRVGFLLQHRDLHSELTRADRAGDTRRSGTHNRHIAFHGFVALGDRLRTLEKFQFFTHLYLDSSWTDAH